MAVNSSLNSKLVGKYSVSNCECIFVDIYLNGSTFIRYGTVYRPPNASYEESIEMFSVIYENVVNVNNFVLLGDFNLPDINWDNLTASTQVSREFLTTCFRIGAHQCVSFPTRLNNITDLVLCSNRNLIQDIHASAPFSTSDHDIINVYVVPHNKQKSQFVSKPCFKKADYALINAFIATLDWNEIFCNCESAEEFWLSFKNIMDTIVLNFVPFTTEKDHGKIPYMSDKLKRLRNIKQRRWQKFSHSRNIVNYHNYRKAASEFQSNFLHAKCQYEEKLFNDKNAKFFFNYIQKNTTVCESIPCLKTTDGNIVTSDVEKATLLSDYFASVFTVDDGNLPQFTSNCTQNFDHFNCDEITIVKIVKGLKTKSAPGPDGFTPYFLKQIIARIAKPLCIVYQMSLNQGFVPSDWKIAHIIPAFKSGDPQLASQYRPISLTSVFSKVLEKVVRDQMVKYLIVNNILPGNQHGFMSKKSRVTNLLECLDKWSSNFDKGHQTDIIYLDYSKCFDSVCHSKLLYKLSQYGFKDSALHWVASFLTGRTQHVKVNNSLSPPQDVISGVPQGTVLGPTLFLCFTADLNSVVKYCNLSMYADDSKIFKEIQNNLDCLLLQLDLNEVIKWAAIWQLQLNATKTKHLCVGHCRFPFRYMVNGTVIETVDHIRDLGFIVQSNLKFTIHCNNVIRKAYNTIRNTFNCFKGHKVEFYMKMYITYIRPILESGSMVWSPLIKKKYR